MPYRDQNMLGGYILEKVKQGEKMANVNKIGRPNLF